MTGQSAASSATSRRLERLLYAHLLIRVCLDSSRALSPLSQSAFFRSAVVAYYASVESKADQKALCADNPEAKPLLKKYRKLRNKSIAHIGDIEQPYPTALEWVNLPVITSDEDEKMPVAHHGVYLSIAHFERTAFEELGKLISMTYERFRDEWGDPTAANGDGDNN